MRAEEGDILLTADGHKFQVSTVRMKGYSGEYLSGPRTGEKIFLDITSFMSEEELAAHLVSKSFSGPHEVFPEDDWDKLCEDLEAEWDEWEFEIEGDGLEDEEDWEDEDED